MLGGINEEEEGDVHVVSEVLTDHGEDGLSGMNVDFLGLSGLGTMDGFITSDHDEIGLLRGILLKVVLEPEHSLVDEHRGVITAVVTPLSSNSYKMENK